MFVFMIVVPTLQIFIMLFGSVDIAVSERFVASQLTAEVHQCLCVMRCRPTKPSNCSK